VGENDRRDRQHVGRSDASGTARPTRLWRTPSTLPALLCIGRLRGRAPSACGAGDDAAPVGGGALDGVVLLVRSPYLLGICLSALTIGTQILLTAHVVARWALTRALPVLPVVSLVIRGAGGRADGRSAGALSDHAAAAQYAISGSRPRDPVYGHVARGEVQGQEHHR
jgi:hypothetical protein